MTMMKRIAVLCLVFALAGCGPWDLEMTQHSVSGAVTYAEKDAESNPQLFLRDRDLSAYYAKLSAAYKMAAGFAERMESRKGDRAAKFFHDARLLAHNWSRLYLGLHEEWIHGDPDFNEKEEEALAALSGEHAYEVPWAFGEAHDWAAEKLRRMGEDRAGEVMHGWAVEARREANARHKRRKQ